jgi:MFS family permease
VALSRRRLLVGRVADEPEAGHGLDRFLLLYALAWAGASIAYIPFLTILLPVRVIGLAGPEQAISWLAYIAFAGAVAASVGHVGFGYLSDITRNRRLWIWLGLALSSTFMVVVPWVDRLSGLIALIICWQLSLNMMLAPLAAMAGDKVPDSRKGRLGGLMAFAPGLGALSGAVVTIPGVMIADTRLWMVAALVALCMLPLLINGGRDQFGQELCGPKLSADAPDDHGFATAWRSALLRMWLARLTIQIGEAALFAFLYVWFRSIDPTMNDNRTASVFSAILILSAPLALVFGRWADQRARPIQPLFICAIASAIGLICMALAHSGPTAVASYAIFGIASSIFLAHHAAQTLRVLPRADRRGRDLGLFNLTNTLPSLIMPWFALMLVPYFGFSALFVLLAGLSLFTALLLAPLVQRTPGVRLDSR